MEPIRVLIADDHPLYRDGMRGLLDSETGTEVVGEASSGEEAIKLAKTLQPDVILMDIKMPGINGIEATREILNTSPQAGILMVTMFEDDDSLFAAMRAGARGYLLKDSRGEEVAHAIRAVAGGEAIFGQGIARRLINYFSALNPSGPPRAFPELTDREEEILALVAQGHSNQEIAQQLFLSLANTKKSRR